MYVWSLVTVMRDEFIQITTNYIWAIKITLILRIKILNPEILIKCKNHSELNQNRLKMFLS